MSRVSREKAGDSKDRESGTKGIWVIDWPVMRAVIDPKSTFHSPQKGHAAESTLTKMLAPTRHVSYTFNSVVHGAPLTMTMIKTGLGPPGGTVSSSAPTPSIFFCTAVGTAMVERHGIDCYSRAEGLSGVEVRWRWGTLGGYF